MKITINGEPQNVDGPIPLAALLTHLNVDSRRVAVEHNLVVVKRERYEATMVNDGDEIEIVNFVGGG